ncbi:hypothetical protein C8Q75DRAFT_83518 [Abortiporus biennis]|nr:hypothetical protein C8Q75DRAFT_83518 [Abortiporus biennis]
MPHSPSTVGKASRLHSMLLWYLVSKGFYERCLHPPDQFWQDQMQRVGLGGLDIARLTEAIPVRQSLTNIYQPTRKLDKEFGPAESAHAISGTSIYLVCMALSTRTVTGRLLPIIFSGYILS